jgi:hypothetical protein
MDRPAKCRQNVADCYAISQQLSDPRSKANMLEMAQSWLLLADHAEHSGEFEVNWSSPRQGSATSCKETASANHGARVAAASPASSIVSVKENPLPRRASHLAPRAV